MLTEKDEELIERARRTPPQLCYLVSDMVDEADTDEARKILKTIASVLYHRDEYEHGLL